MASKIKVFIVGNESKNDNGTSAFNWWRNEDTANKDYWDTIKNFINSDQIVYRGSLEVESDFEDGTDEQIDQITDKVERFLEENNWEESFK